VVTLLLAGLNHHGMPPDRLTGRTLGLPQLVQARGLLLGQRLPLDDLLRVGEQLTPLGRDLVGVGEQSGARLVEGAGG